MKRTEKVNVEFSFTVKVTRNGEEVQKTEMNGSLSATNVRETFEAAARGFKEGLLHDEKPCSGKNCRSKSKHDGFDPVR